MKLWSRLKPSVLGGMFNSPLSMASMPRYTIVFTALIMSSMSVFIADV